MDDEADIRKLVSLMLKGRNVNAITTDNADEAIEILNKRAKDVAVVLLDLSIPHSGDSRPIDRLRSEYPNIPVIIMTGLADEEATGGRTGDTLVGYLRKPFRPAALYDAIAQRGRMADPARRRSRRDLGGRTSDENRFRSPPTD